MKHELLGSTATTTPACGVRSPANGAQGVPSRPRVVAPPRPFETAAPTPLAPPVLMTPPMGPPQPLQPILVPIRKAVEISGLSRSTIYLRAKAGELTLKKAGKTTLVDYASLRALLEGLPTARLKTAA